MFFICPNHISIYHKGQYDLIATIFFYLNKLHRLWKNIIRNIAGLDISYDAFKGFCREA